MVSNQQRPKEFYDKLEQIGILTEEIVVLEQSLKEKRKARKLLYETCNHDWEVEHKPETKEGYTIPADSHGSDFQPSCYVPPKTTHKWTRTCRKCGLVQHTDQHNVEQKKSEKTVPVWRR